MGAPVAGDWARFRALLIIPPTGSGPYRRPRVAANAEPLQPLVALEAL
jgi:hypothetical protein